MPTPYISKPDPQSPKKDSIGIIFPPINHLESKRETVMTGIMVFATILNGIAVLAFATNTFQRYPTDPFINQYGVLTLVFLIAAILSGFSIPSANKISTSRMASVIISVQIALFILAALVKNLGTQATIVSLVFSMTSLFAIAPRQTTEWPISGIVIGATLASILNTQQVIPQLESPGLQILFPYIIVFLVMSMITLFLTGLLPTTIQVKWISTALAIYLVPLFLPTTPLFFSLIAGIFVIATAFISRSLCESIINLIITTEKINGGNLGAVAEVNSNDEIGKLGVVFNRMTSQLSSSIAELKDGINKRTEELAEQKASLSYRSQQLKTISDVAHRITSTQDLATLLDEVTKSISERFGFYHVGIFLLDDRKEFAVLRASNSEGGRRMLARQHKLPIGQTGIVGYVTGTGLSRITSDTGIDAVYYDNPDLPLTRSEMAIPLKVGDDIIGALDVQSTESNSFHEEDIELFSILADQIAIAISNNRLYEKTISALEEMQNVHRKYLQQEWGREYKARKNNSFIYSSQESQINTLNSTLLPEIQKVLDTKKPFIQSIDSVMAESETPSIQRDISSDTHDTSSGKDKTALMAIPIILRGEPIGAIQLQDPQNSNRVWNVEEIATVQAVADQVAQALENARLLEQSIRRAERERKVLEITGKIRSTNDFDEMMQIAIRELQQTLNASQTQIIFQFKSRPGETALE